MKTRSGVVVLVFGGLLALGIPIASADPVAIVNPSFEHDPSGTTSITGWNTPVQVKAKTWSLLDPDFSWVGYSAIDGNQIGQIEGGNGTISQTLNETYKIGYTYTLSFWARNWSSTANDAYADGGLRAVLDDGWYWLAICSFWANKDQWVRYTCQFTVTNPALEGKPIIIYFSQNRINPDNFEAIEFDNVTLDAFPPPDPATIIPIENPSFEYDPSNSPFITGWDTPVQVNSKTWDVTDPDFSWVDYPAVHGSKIGQVASVGSKGGTFSQTLSETYQMGYTYTLSFWARNWYSGGEDAYADVGLRAVIDDGWYWLAICSFWAEKNQWRRYTCEFTVTDPAMIGKNIIIYVDQNRINLDNFEAIEFDDFVLTAVPRDNSSGGKGHEYLLEKGFQLMGCGWSTNWDNWLASGFNTMRLTGAIPPTRDPLLGGPWAIGKFPDQVPWDGTLSREELPARSSLVLLRIADEFDLNDPVNREKMATWFSMFRAKNPDLEVLIGSNEWGLQVSDENMRAYMSLAQPDFVSMDYYPFSRAGNLYSDITHYYRSLQQYRLLGLGGNDGSGANPIPYGLYLDLFKSVSEGFDDFPSDSEMRLNQFSAWVFGYKIAEGFIYNSWGNDPNINLVSPLFAEGETTDEHPTEAFYQLAETNRQSLNLGPSLVRLLSTHVFFDPGQDSAGTVHPVPAEVPQWSTASDPSYITAVNVQNLGTKNGGKRGDVLIGYFKPLVEDDDGPNYTNETYFMIVNGLSTPDATVQETTQRITVDFDFGSSGINSLQRLSRTTGLVERVALTHLDGSKYRLELQLDGGTGDLFKYNTGAAFVGATAQAPIPGDANEDGKVDVGDLGILAANYGGTDKTWSQGDFNGDGKVDVGDLGILAANYGTGSSGADFNADYARIFGTQAGDSENSSLFCGSLGISLIAGIAMFGWMMLKTEE
jgi:hypothetical protein